MIDPSIMWQIVKIHQAELRQEAAEQRAARRAQADSSGTSRQRLVVTFAASTLIALWLVWMFMFVVG